MKQTVFYSAILSLTTMILSCQSKQGILWQIGQLDNSSSEFALAPDQYGAFLDNDFGFEDKYFIIGHSEESRDFPYVLPGPVDTWGGTWGTSGWRTNQVNIMFGLEEVNKRGDYKLVIHLSDFAKKFLPLLKISVNGQEEKVQLLAPGYEPDKQPKPGLQEPTVDENILISDISSSTNQVIEILIKKGVLKNGGNAISLTTLEGSWIKFDQVRLEGPGDTKLRNNRHLFLRDVQPAAYEIQTERGVAQPLLVDVQHLSGTPVIEVTLDGENIFHEKVEIDRYIFEAPMPAVESEQESSYEIHVDGGLIDKGKVHRTPQTQITQAGYVDTKMGVGHSRWMIAPGPWMPFSMVKLSPDNQNGGWQSGYQPSFESIGTFSHIHEWTMSGLGIMPANGPLMTEVGDESRPDEGYRSRLNTQTEVARLGYYKAELTDYGVTAELTATTRCGFQRYTFPGDREGSRVLIDLQIPAEYQYELEDIRLEKVSDYRLEGHSKQLAPNTWGRSVSQEYTVYFVIEFDQAISNIGFWTEKGVIQGTALLEGQKLEDAGAFIEFNTSKNPIVQVRTGISYVSLENAGKNLMTEITKPFEWDFEAVRQYNVDSWNALLKRVRITSNDQREKRRFYTNMYRALCSRNTFSDVDGKWVDSGERIRQFKDSANIALGCDAFWNTFWNLNQFWNLVTPEWSNRWVNSQLAMYDAAGWLAKGPAGMEYIPVMVAEHEIPLIVGAFQMGIRDFDVEKAFEAVKKMQTTPAQPVDGGIAGNHDLESYMKYKYVPYDKGRFSNSLEYSFDDWTVAQFAKALGKDSDYYTFLERGYYWKNIIDRETGYARMKDSKGDWFPDFDPYKSGANHHYVEGNAWQLTYFVPQDVPALAEAIGKDRFIDRLDWGFAESDKTRFNGKNDQYWNFPVVQGNQQSMHFAFLFNWVGKPWLTQKYSRKVLERYYGYGINNAYLGDEDQGQMSGWFLIAALGLFQTDGGCRVDPVYEIGSPLFRKVEISLDNRYGRGDKFIIEAKNASRLNKYVQSATLNGKPLQDFKFPASELLNGGELELDMGPEPNEMWGIGL